VGGTTAQAAEDGKRRRKRAPRHPGDFENEQEFIQHVRTLFDKDREADEENRREMVTDLRFTAGEQWEDSVRQRRDAAGKPTLTVNTLPAYVAQIVGNRRLNDVGIKIIPDNGGTKKVAEVREGLIRSIQKLSKAQFAYDTAFEQQVITGLGNFQILLDYAHDDVFEQDIRIAAIPNALAVVWDHASVEPSGADARHVFVVDTLDRKEFKRRYPKAHAGWDATELERRAAGWDTADSTQIVSFWRMRSKTRLLALMQDGTVQDVTDLGEEEWWDAAVQDEHGLPMVREVQRKYAQMYLCSSQEILDGPYDLPIQRVPVFRVPAWELHIEGERKRWGLVRFLRDPKRLHNYWRSTIAEKLVGSPKAKWVAADTAVEGREDSWRRSHLEDDPLLIYNADSSAPPMRVQPADVETALIQEAGMAAQDIRDVSNIHEASLGQRSNEVSGRAIMARQRVGEVGTTIFQDRLNLAIEEAGGVINQLIPFVYDTPRIIKVLGPDSVQDHHVRINDEQDPDSVDITEGKYSVTVTTGPSYTTRRVEAREEMMALTNAMPDVMAVAADKIVEAQDWPGADEIARRLRMRLPPGMLSADDIDPEQRQQMEQQAQQQAQEAQMQQQIQMQTLQLEMALKEAQIAEAHARAQESLARAEQAQSSVPKNITSAAKNLSDIDNNSVASSLRVVTSLSQSPNGATG
jgi:hypothetical protein